MIHFHTAGMSDRDRRYAILARHRARIADDSRSLSPSLSSASFLVFAFAFAFPSGAPDRNRPDSDQVQSLDA